MSQCNVEPSRFVFFASGSAIAPASKSFSLSAFPGRCLCPSSSVLEIHIARLLDNLRQPFLVFTGGPGLLLLLLNYLPLLDNPDPVVQKDL